MSWLWLHYIYNIIVIITDPQGSWGPPLTEGTCPPPTCWLPACSQLFWAWAGPGGPERKGPILTAGRTPILSVTSADEKRAGGHQMLLGPKCPPMTTPGHQKHETETHGGKEGLAWTTWAQGHWSDSKSIALSQWGQPLGVYYQLPLEGRGSISRNHSTVRIGRQPSLCCGESHLWVTAGRQGDAWAAALVHTLCSGTVRGPSPARLGRGQGPLCPGLGPAAPHSCLHCHRPSSPPGRGHTDGCGERFEA